jgi:HAD superfamily hydrolase (TIGR01509 family)
MKPDLVIFDCDGVLVDSEPIANRILVDALAEVGYAVSLEQAVEKFVGRSMASVVALVETELGQPLPDGFLDSVQQATFAVFRAELQPMRGVADAIDRINVPVCVASSGMPEKIALSLSVTGLANKFDDHVFSAAMVAHGKPAPDLFLLAAERMAAAPTRTIVIEDSLPGIEAAYAANMKALGFVGGGHTGADLIRRLRAIGAEVFDDMNDLPELIDNLD